MKLIKIPLIQTILFGLILVFSTFAFAGSHSIHADTVCFACGDIYGQCCTNVGPYQCASLIKCRGPQDSCQFGPSYPAFNCNGIYQCSACPDPTGGGTCGEWGEWTTCNNGSQSRCQEGAGCACESRDCIACASSSPIAPDLVSPGDNTLLSNNSAVLNWYNASGGWGTGCPQENSYRIRFKIIPNGTTDCSVGGWQAVDVANQPGTTNKTYTLNGLEWNSTYCWQVRRRNGSIATTSNQTWRFQTPAAPIIISSGFIHNDVCGAGISGRTDSLAPVTNPIQFEFTYTKAASLSFQDAYIALLPQTGPYAENATYQTFDIINGKVANSGTFAARMSSLTSSPNISTLNRVSTNGGYGWYGNAISGEIANNMFGANTVDVVNINNVNGTSVNITGDQATVRFQLKLENVLPSGSYNVYVIGGTNALSTGTQPGTSAIYYTKVGTWGVDMTNPSVSVSAPESLGGNQYRINFSANDAGYFPSGIKEARSYASASKPNTILFNSTYGYTLSNLPQTLPAFPAVGNGGINQTNLGNSEFVDQSPALLADYSLNLAAIDNACNVSQAATVNIKQSAPWILVAKGAASAIGGFTNLTIPNIAFSGSLTQYSPRSVVSTDLTLFGNNGSLSNNLVLKRKFDNQYSNKAVLPGNSSFSNWYDYLYALATKNNMANVYTSTRSTLGVKISDFDIVGGGATPCTPTTPGGVTLLSPANSANLTTMTNATLQWEHTTADWGEGCPVTPFYRVLYKRLTTGTDCSVGTWSSVDVTQQSTSPIKSTNLTGLTSNSNYCWQVQRRNGSALFSTSSIRLFKTASSPANGGGTTISPTTDGSQLMQELEAETKTGSVAGTANARQYYLVNNPEFRILSGTVCDQRALIFVNGNLTIEPDFTNSSVENGCIFIVKGNVTIEKGTTKTSVALGSSIDAGYDEIQAFIIANGTFTAIADNNLPTLKWDGLRIVGGVFANQLVLQRNLNTTANDTQPAHLVVYDPRYRVFFGSDLSAKTYSLREE